MTRLSKRTRVVALSAATATSIYRSRPRLERAALLQD